MNFAVGIACLMVVAVLGEVAGTPNKQLLVKDESKIEDGSSIFLREDLEEDLKDLELATKSIKKKKTKLHCKIVGGQCEHKKKECHGGYGWCFEGKDYCTHHEHYCCCVPPPPEGCVFGDKSYPHKSFIRQSCIRIQCLDGIWNFNVDEIDPECGRCSAYPLSIINPFDRNTYIFNETGTYAFTHDYNDYAGVDVVLGNCTEYGTNITYSCVESFYFHDLGINIQIYPGSPYTGDGDWVKVNGQYVTIPSGSVNSFYATRGTVLVYKESVLSYYLVSSIGFSVHISRQGLAPPDTITTLTVWTKQPSLENSEYCLCAGAGSLITRSNDHPVAGRSLPKSRSNNHPVAGRSLPKSNGLVKKKARLE